MEKQKREEQEGGKGPKEECRRIGGTGQKSIISTIGKKKVKAKFKVATKERHI